MRCKLIAGNWKMNGSLAALDELAAIEGAACSGAIDVAIALPATLIAPAAGKIACVAVGVQDVGIDDSGPHTGCVSAAMAREAGASFTIVGHSERRADQCEGNDEVRAKAEAARRAGLTVILCVGESAEQRDAGHAENVVTGQVTGSMPDGADPDWLTIAYEPIWAIGTGRTPTVDDVAAMHGAIRRSLRGRLGEPGTRMRILYGGSVTGENASTLLAASDVDGALVGGASLTAAKFVPIIRAAEALVQP